jgi:leucyl-tRNA synthetase
LVERYGADTLRCYEMFLGPLTQHKPWDTQGISGVHNFLRKLHRLFSNASTAVEATDEQYRVLHKTIKKVSDDLDRCAFNTVISALMIGVNELLDANAQAPELLQPLAILASPVAPHLAEELWSLTGGEGSVLDQPWPQSEERWLVADEVTYPVSFNGKVRFQLVVDANLDKAEVEKLALAHDKAKANLEGKTVRKVIVVPGRIVNIVVS